MTRAVHRFQRQLSCQFCGQPYETYPPDETYTLVTLQRPSRDHIKTGACKAVPHECDNCHKVDTLYWENPMKIRAQDANHVSVMSLEGLSKRSFQDFKRKSSLGCRECGSKSIFLFGLKTRGRTKATYYVACSNKDCKRVLATAQLPSTRPTSFWAVAHK